MEFVRGVDRTVVGAGTALLWQPTRPGIFVSADTIALALPLAAMAADLPVLAVVAAAAVTGLVLSISTVSWNTLIQVLVPAERLSRTKSYTLLGETIFVPVGYITAGPISDAVGVDAVLAGCATLMAAAAIALLLVPDVRRLVLVPADIEAARVPAGGTEGGQA